MAPSHLIGISHDSGISSKILLLFLLLLSTQSTVAAFAPRARSQRSQRKEPKPLISPYHECNTRSCAKPTQPVRPGQTSHNIAGHISKAGPPTYTVHHIPADCFSGTLCGPPVTIVESNTRAKVERFEVQKGGLIAFSRNRQTV